MTVKPTDSEEEHFARLEFERRKQVAQKKTEKLAAEERERLQKLHFMRCPKCGMELAEIDFRKIRIDRCTACSGVWLDAGELDSIAAEEQGSGFLSVFSGFLGNRQGDS